MKWLAVFVVRLSPRDDNLYQFTVCQKSDGVPRWKCNSTVPKGGWNFLLHMWLECVCRLQRGIWPLKTDRLLHTSHQLLEQHCVCPKFFVVTAQSLPHLFPTCSPIQSVPTQSSWLYSNLDILLAFWVFSLLSIWWATSPIKLQLKLGPAWSSYPT